MNYGINYMGSKNGIAEGIVFYISSRHPDKTVFVDAFCGGLAISHCIARNTSLQVLANDLDPYVTSFYTKLIVDPEWWSRIKYRWVPRLTYLAIQKNPNAYAPWVVGWVLSTWSFGGRGDSYLYAEDKEEEKHDLFDAIVNDKWSKKLQKTLDTIPDYYQHKDTASSANKRKQILSYYQKVNGEKTQLENLSRVERIDGLLPILNTRRISISCDDYKGFINSLPPETLKNAIIYLDPPYENTAEYTTNSIDYSDFWNFVRSLKDVCPVYVSSYTAPEDIEDVWSVDKVVAFNSNTQNGTIAIKRNKKTEHLFYNGYENKTLTLSDLLG